MAKEFKAECVGKLGEKSVSENTKMVAEITRYNDGDPRLSFMTMFSTKKEPDKWGYGTRPSFRKEDMGWVAKMVNDALDWFDQNK